MLRQRFELVDDANDQLKIHETLTVKPDGFTMKVRRRSPVAVLR
jgi:cytochrome P450/NADPH-cytochrome P450 reductase